MRPVTPDPSSRISLEIFNEHKSLAQEFLKVSNFAHILCQFLISLTVHQVQTEIAYVTQHREEVLSKMDPETRRQKLDYCSKLEERDALLKLEANLRKQLELINQSKAQDQGQGMIQQQVRNPREFPVQHNRLQSSGGTLTNQSMGMGLNSGSRVVGGGGGGLTDSSPTSSGEDNWVFLDPSKM